MFLLVPAHPGCPGQNPNSCKMVVVVVVTDWEFFGDLTDDKNICITSMLIYCVANSVIEILTEEKILLLTHTHTHTHIHTHTTVLRLSGFCPGQPG